LQPCGEVVDGCLVLSFHCIKNGKSPEQRVDGVEMVLFQDRTLPSGNVLLPSLISVPFAKSSMLS